MLRESGWTHEDDAEVQKLDFTKQIEKLNEHPINQRAREILEELAPTYYEVNQELRPKITEDRKNIDIEYGISPWWGLDVIILLEWAVWRDVGMLMDSWGFFFGGALFVARSSNGDTSISSSTSGNTPLLRL